MANNSMLKHGEKVEYCPSCGWFNYNDEFKTGMTVEKYQSKSCPHCIKGKTVLAAYHENPTSFTGLMPLNGAAANIPAVRRRL